MLILKSNKENFINIFSQAHKKNEPVIFPTDTIYGIGAFFNDEKANNKIFDLKNRDYSKPFPVLISNINQLSYLKADLSDAQLKVLNKFWPGKFTFILNTSLNYKYCVLEAKIAVRLVSNLPVADLIDYFDKPVTATSANFSGQEYDPSIKNIIKNFSNKVNYYIYQGTDNKNPSSIIDLTIPGYRIIRNSHNIKLEDL